MTKEEQEEQRIAHEYYMRVGLAMFKLDKAYETSVEGSIERDKAYEDYRQQRNDAYTDYREARKAKWNLEYVIGQPVLLPEAMQVKNAADLSATELMVAIRNEKRKAYEVYLEFCADDLSIDLPTAYKSSLVRSNDTWNLEGAFASYVHGKYRSDRLNKLF